jgi:hypothetical protein
LDKPGDRVLGRRVRHGVGPRGVGGDRAVVDDAPAARVLALHHPEGLPGAQERPGQIDVHHRFPLLDAELIDLHAGWDK